MKSKFENAKNQKLTIKRVNLYIYLLSAICAALFVFGCNEPLQTFSHYSANSLENLRPEANRIIQRGLADDDPRIRVKAIEVVADTQQIKLMPKVQRLLKDEFVPVRFAAARAVGNLKYRLAETSLKQLLKAPDENTRIAAAYAMFKLGSAESLELVRKAITSHDSVVRANAAFLLGKSGDKTALKLLYWALTDKNSDDRVRLNAIQAIAMLGDEQILEKRLWSLTYSAYSDVRLVGIEGMGALGTRKARDILITKLDDDVLELRLAAAEQLGMLGDTTGEAEVLDVFRKNLTAGPDRESLERIKARTAHAIGQIGTAPVVKFLPQLLKNESKVVRIAAAKAVLQCTRAN